MTRELPGDGWILISDIDGTLIGERNPGLAELSSWISSHRRRLLYGLASGRHLDLTRQAVDEHGLPPPDVWICLVGVEIYHGPDAAVDRDWRRRISHRWDRAGIENVMSGVDQVRMQEAEFQSAHKVSYYVDDGFDSAALRSIHRKLEKSHLRANVILSHDRYLDFLPYRASKGHAVRYLRKKYGVRAERCITCGNSGNDADMLRGPGRGIVVGDHSPELDSLRDCSDVFFADSPLAAGILEGLRHYGVVE